MAVALLDAVVTDVTGYTSTLTVSAGANRRLYFITHTGHATAVVRPTAVTYGTVSMTRLGSQAVTALHDVCVTVWDLDETGIAAAANTTVVVTGGSVINASHWWSVKDASQGSHTVGEDITAGSSGAVGLARGADGYTGVAFTHDAADTFDTSTNPTLTNEDIFGAHVSAIGHEASTSETVDATWTHGFSRNNEQVVWTIGPAAAGANPHGPFGHPLTGAFGGPI